MKKYVIVTDSGSDLSQEILRKYGIISMPLFVRFEGEDERSDYSFSPNEFYQRIRGGAIAKTSAVNYSSFLEKFKSIAERGYDVLYIGLSSGISSTYSSARAAADVLKREFRQREFLTLDSKCASAGLGLLVCLTAEKRNDGANIHEAFAYAESIAPRICHRFTVDDLSYLRRGGRISPASAFLANALGIKPLLYVDNGGFLKSSEKVRGRRGAIDGLASSYGAFNGAHTSDCIFISHADCKQDALLLDDMLHKKYGCHAKRIFDIGAVIGAHAGPGTLALFFVGDTR